MALIMMDGFDTYEDNYNFKETGWFAHNTNTNYTAQSKYTDISPYASAYFRSDGYLDLQMPTNPTTVIIGFDTYATSWVNFFSGHSTGNYMNVELFERSARQLGITWGQYGVATMPIRVWDGDNVEIARGITPWEEVTWYNVTLKVVLHPTEGELDIYVNGVREIALRGVSTTSTTNAWSDFLRFRNGHNYNNSYYTMFDNLYVFDDTGTECNEVIPNARIITRMPIADDLVVQDWTGTFEDVDDPTNIHDGDATYMSADTLNEESRFTFQPIEGVVPNAVCHAVKFKGATSAYDGDFFTSLTASHGASTIIGDELQNASEWKASTLSMSLSPAGTELTEQVVDAIQGGVKVTDIRNP